MSLRFTCKETPIITKIIILKLISRQHYLEIQYQNQQIYETET